VRFRHPLLRADSDGERYEVSLRTLLGAVEAEEEGIP